MPNDLSPIKARGGITALPSATRIPSDREMELVGEELREFGQFQVWRNTGAQQWEETSELILPTSRNTFFYGNFNWPGQKKTQQQVDATGALALHRFCAIADSLVTPRNMFWHGVESDPYVMKDRASRLWLERLRDTLFRERYKMHANFAAQNYNNWQSLGAFGNSTMYVDKYDNRWFGGEQGLRYRAVPLGETFYGENHQGRVDRMLRWFKCTAYQAVQKWGLHRIPQNLLAPLQQDSMWPYNFLHVCKPNPYFDPERLDARAFPFINLYISLEGRCLMEEPSGYRIFPYAVSRYDQTPGEVYGRGPAQIVLAGLKTLNAQKRTFLKQGHRAADPILLLSDDGLVGMDMRPGAQNKGGVTADGKPLVHTLPVGNIQINEKMMGEERSIIDDVFMVSLFKVLTEHPDMTATQVIELVNEKGMLVAPTMGRQHSEYVGGMVEREVDLLGEMGKLEPMPPRLREARGEYQVTDTSPLAQAAKAGRAAGFLRSIETSKELVNITQDPSHLDWADMDTAMPEIARINNTPEHWIADDATVKAKRQARAQNMQRQEEIQSMPAQAAMIKAQATVQKAQPGLGAQVPGGGAV